MADDVAQMTRGTVAEIKDGETDRRAVVTADGELLVKVNASAAPEGGATAAHQVTQNTALANLNNFGAGEYETVAAGQTDQVLGPTGGANDYLQGVLIIPATTSPGAVAIKDGAGSAITIFTGGADSVSSLVPFFVPLGIKCATSWKLTTGTNVTAIGIGNFT